MQLLLIYQIEVSSLFVPDDVPNAAYCGYVDVVLFDVVDNGLVGNSRQSSFYAELVVG